ncbi:MAG: DUF4912 domain-containing protein [Thermoguttaceae bacterium]|nr:DUF4912 domain-containing protein [Thermoguttaceae bacterium]
MLTETELRMRTVQELTVIARDYRIHGWHALRKEGLIQAILSVEHGENASIENAAEAMNVARTRRETFVRRQSPNCGDNTRQSKGEGSMRKKKDSSQELFGGSPDGTLSDDRGTPDEVQPGSQKKVASDMESSAVRHEHKLSKDTQDITVRLRHFSVSDEVSEKSSAKSRASKKRSRSERVRDLTTSVSNSAIGTDKTSEISETSAVRSGSSDSSSESSKKSHGTSFSPSIATEGRGGAASFLGKGGSKIEDGSELVGSLEVDSDSSESRGVGPSRALASGCRAGDPAAQPVKECDVGGGRPVRMASESEKKFHRLRARLSKTRDLAQVTEDQEIESDQLMLRAQGAFWLEASWVIRRCTMERARAALAHLWHDSRPVLRLSEIVGDGTTTTVRRIVRLVDIHGGVNHWYVNVDEPPRTYQMEIGYIDPENRFIGLAKSNLITTSPDAESPIPAASVKERKAEEAELNTNGVGTFEDRLRKSLGPGLRQPFTWTPSRFLYGEGGEGVPGFHFEVDAALVVYGATDPGVRLTLRGEPVRIQADGTFMIRFSLPNRRQVIPIVAQSIDGLEQRTVIIAVERNTKVMEPIICEPGESND